VTTLFITATGTDIGKTFVTAGLIHALRRQGRTIDALKPVLSGYDPAQLAASDAGQLLAAMGRPLTDAEAAQISPWRFSAPLSPDMAAAREGRAIDFDQLIAFCRRRVAETADVLLVEGVGGVMVPLDDRHTVLDWMAALDAPVLLVAGSYLGTISHTLTAFEMLRSRGPLVAAVIVSETPGSTVGLQETIEAIRRFVTPVAVVALPRLAAADQPNAALDEIIRILPRPAGAR
jgi:dethiobiotin synthetase